MFTSATTDTGGHGHDNAIADGVHTANIALIGQYMASEFAVSSDGHGGTLITYTSATTATGGHGPAMQSHRR